MFLTSVFPIIRASSAYLISKFKGAARIGERRLK